MKYQGIRKIHEGKFITRYDVDYVTAEGHGKTYEIISRNRDITTLEALQNKKADSVIMILTDKDGERILVNREYRMAMAQWIYNFPAGLIDPGETPEECFSYGSFSSRNLSPAFKAALINSFCAGVECLNERAHSPTVRWQGSSNARQTACVGNVGVSCFGIR